MLDTVRPAYFIPIHGEMRHLIRHGKLAREMGVPHVEVAGNGEILEFSSAGMTRAGLAPVGRLFVDGKGVGDVEGLVLKDRYHLSQDGLVMVVLALSSGSGEILFGPDIVTRGVVTENGAEPLIEGARETVLKVWEEATPETRKDHAEIKTDIRKAMRRFFNKRLERKPVIIPVLLEL